MKEKLVIIGNSDFAELCTYYLEKIYEICAYCVDKEFISEKYFMGKPVVSFDELASLYNKEKYQVFVAIGYNKRNSIRAKMINKVIYLGYNIISYIHNTSIVDKTVKIGKNCMVLENSILQPFVKVDDGCIVWANSTICHHTEVGKNCFICSNSCINGYVHVSENSFIGAGAIIRDKITISKNNIIGAGCVIQENTGENNVFKNSISERIF